MWTLEVLTFLLIMRLATANALDDLSAEVQNSPAYFNINNKCAKCALAGDDGGSGCWGQTEKTGVYVSACLTGGASCFCAEGKQQIVANGIQEVANEIARHCGSSPSVVGQLGLEGYSDFCRATLSSTATSVCESLPSPAPALFAPSRILLRRKSSF